MNSVGKSKGKRKGLLGLITVVAMILTMMVPVYAADNEVYIYDSTYKSGSLSWKMYNRLQGYDQMGTYITDVGTFTATYEYRTGGTSEGDLIYKWVWDGTKFHTPVLADAKGPTNLTVTTAYSEEDKSLEIYAPLKNQIHGDSSTYEQDGKTYYKYPAVCDGYAELTLKVSDYYEDGTVLVFTGEYNAVSKTPEDKEFYEEGTVENGYVTIKLDRGGTYTAKEKEKPQLEITSLTAGTTEELSNPKYVKLQALATEKENLQYRFVVLKEGKCVFARGYKEKNSCTWVPCETGNYQVVCKVIDGEGNEVSTSIDYYAEACEFKMLNYATRTGNFVDVGNKVNLGILSEAGVGDINYRFVVLKDGVNVYTRAYSKKNYCSWTPTESGSYVIYFKAKDNTGNTLVSTLDFEVK